MTQPDKIPFADYFGLGFDLRFHFIFPIPAQIPESQTPLLGFTPDVLDAIRSLRNILLLPQHPWEIGQKRENVTALRMSGNTYQIIPIPLLGLPYLTFDARTPLVCFVTNRASHETISAYREKLGFPTLQISPINHRSAVHISDVRIGHLCALLENVRRFYKNAGHTDLTNALDEIDLRKRSWKRKHLPIPKHHHLCVLPNELALESFGFAFQREIPLAGHDDDPYVEAITNSSDAIIQQRKAVLCRPGLCKPPPLTLILTVPGFYKHVYGRIHVPKGDLAPAVKAFKCYARQRGYSIRGKAEDFHEMLHSEQGQSVIHLYQEEIEAYSLCVAVKAANHFAPVMRLPPILNHLGSEIDKIARNARSNSPHIAFKQNKLMRAFKEMLRRLIPDSFLSRIDDPSNVIKLIANAPLEWIPVRGLPLMLRNDTSRIPTTPGNLLYELSVSPGEYLATTESLQNVLIIRSYAADDPIRNLLPVALTGLPINNLKVDIVEVETEAQLVAAFRSFPGGIAIFDGHGRPATGGQPGKLLIGKTTVDVWTLRGEFRPPPIVILSACDTHSFDTSHASVANSFLLLGAKTAVGTTLPIDARHASLFIARLLYRLDEYLPMLTAKLDRPVRWISVMAGLQRMMFVTELREFLKRTKVLSLSREEDIKVAIEANWPVVGGSSEWFEQVIDVFARAGGTTKQYLTNKIHEDFNLPEALKYVQLGNPEQILVLDSTQEKQIFGTDSPPSRNA